MTAICFVLIMKSGNFYHKIVCLIYIYKDIVGPAS